MRAVFVNHCHPDTPHVCALRMREFAAAMARRGHRIVLLTETLHPEDPAPEAAALPELLAAHDWTRPFRLACRPVAAPWTRRLQAQALPAVLSKPTVLWCYLARGGVFWTWTEGSRCYWQPLAKAFRPDVVWGGFGNVDTLDIARGIAATSGCPWVMDVKDYWSVYLPAPLRAPVARRYRDAAAMTAQSETNRDEIAPWFGGAATVVRSGFPAAFLDRPPPPADGCFRLMLTGSVYDDNALRSVIDGFARWVAAPDAPREAAFVYAGADHARIRAAARRLDGVCAVDVAPFLPLEELFDRQRQADANHYFRSRTFHHKLIELLAARRPIIAVPGEGAEAQRLAAEAGLPLHAGRDGDALSAALSAAQTAPCGPLPADPTALRRLTWEAQAAVLETALAGTAAAGRQEIAGHAPARVL